MGVIFYARTTELAFNYIENQIEYVVEETSLRIESIYRDIQFMVAQMNVDPVLSRHAMNQFTSVNEKIIGVLELNTSNAVIATLTQNPFIQDFFLIFPSNKTVLSNRGRFSLESLIQFELLGDVSYVNSILNFVNQHQPFSYYWVTPTDEEIGGIIPNNDLLLLHSFQPNLTPSGVFLWIINLQAINRLLRNIDISNGGFIVLRNSQGTIIHSIHRDTSSFHLVQNDETYSITGDYSYWSKESANRFINLEVYLDNATLYSQISFITNTTLLIIIIIVILNTLIIILFSLQSSRSLGAIMQTLGSFSSNDSSKTFGLKYIQESITGLVTQSKELQSEVNRQRPVINSLIMESLIGGIHMEEVELEKLLTEADIRLGNNHCCFIIQISSSIEISAISFYKEFFLKTGMIKETLQELVPGKTYYLLHGSDKIVYVHGMTSNHIDEYYSKLITQLKKAFEQLTQTLEFNLRLVVGEPVNQVSKIKSSYDQAMMLLSTLGIEEEHQFVEYSLYRTTTNKPYFPMDIEIRLLNAVRVGDQQNLNKIITKIDEENSIKELTPVSLSLLMVEMKGSLIKMLSNMDSSEETALEPILQFINSDHLPFRWEEFLTLFHTNCLEIMNCYQVTSKKKYNGLNESEVIGYIHDHFADINLSLTGIADKFNVNEKYLSRFIKDQVQINYHAYLEDLRLNHAKQLLDSSQKNLSQIALESGYASRATFTRAFKRKFGKIPSFFSKNN